MTTTQSVTQPVDIVVASGNQGKLSELRSLLGPGFRIQSAGDLGADLPEETETTFAGNARLKAVAVARQTGMIAIADDSGLEVRALNGAPGVYSARYSGANATDATNREKLLHELRDVPAEDRHARFVSVIAIAFSPDDVETAEGTVDGLVTFGERGSGGFGYDSLFELPGGKTMAEISSEEKNAISHRGRAMVQARDILARRLDRSDGAEGDLR
ncbi:MAG TPA: RdgB/HAM1 family non-canonical purine NTP pyrophosphatase [Thermomicrobiales bacterium]|nr:RdgB/HAM1 family non-canonical purine NTP pyrophosphatase [Thermomicrobiales bacterium]